MCLYLFNIIVIVRLEKLYQQQKPENKTTGMIKIAFAYYFFLLGNNYILYSKYKPS